MALDKQVLMMALSCTSDPEQAARFADLLGEDAQRVRPAVAFPSDWVIAQQKKDAKAAAYAVSHCANPVTLDAIEPKAKRVTVRQALAENAWLSEDTRKRMLARADAEGDYQVRRMLQRTPPPPPPKPVDEQFMELLATTDFNDDDLREFNRLSGDDSITSAMVDDLVERSLIVGNAYFPANILKARYVNSYGSNAVIAKTTKTASEIIERLSAEDLTLTLEEMVSSMQSSYRREHLVDAEMFSLIIEKTSPGFAGRVVAGRHYRTTGWLTSDAVSMAIEHVEWRPLVKGHDLTDDQFKRFAELLEDHEVRLALEFVEGGWAPRNSATRNVIESVLKRMGPSSLLERDAGLSKILATYATSTDDPLVGLLLSVRDPATLHDYVQGAWQDETGQTIWPTCEELVEIAASMPFDPTTVRGYEYLVTSGTGGAEYKAVLLDELPGIARALLASGNNSVRRHVFERLVQTGAPIDMALDQLSSNTMSSLRRICQATANLAALER